MNKEDIAIFVSVFSVFIAAIALGWNIYREFLKPRVKVRFGWNLLFDEGGVESEPKLVISAINFGPGKIKLDGIHQKPLWAFLKKIFRRNHYRFLLYRSREPLSDQIPCDAEVGDRKNFFLPSNTDYVSNKFSTIGLRDSLERIHWAPKKDYKKARKEYEERIRDARRGPSE